MVVVGRLDQKMPGPIFLSQSSPAVSYLYRRGKRRAYTTAIKHLTDLLPLCRYGDPEESLEVQEEVITAARQYMVLLYDRSDFGGTLDALRAHLFVSIKGDMRCLPPTEDAFQLHLRRALHQLAVCKRAHMVQPTYPAATDFGRQLVKIGGNHDAERGKTVWIQTQPILPLQEKHVCPRMLLCKSQCEVWHCMSLHWGPQQMFKDWTCAWRQGHVSRPRVCVYASPQVVRVKVCPQSSICSVPPSWLSHLTGTCT